MACKLGLQDVSYDPDLHTGEVDFEFFEPADSAVGGAQTINSNPTIEVHAMTVKCQGNSVNNFNEKFASIEPLKYETDNSSTGAEDNNVPGCSRHQESDSDADRGEPSAHRESKAGNEPDYRTDPETESDDESSGDHLTDSVQSSPGTERLEAVVRDVSAIQESLHRLRLSASSLRTPPDPAEPAVGPSESGRARRPRPRSGWPQRKRWSRSLAEAALTQRQIAQLLRAESDSSSSDMVGVSDSDSESGAAGSADVETWLGGGAAAADRSGSSARSTRSVRPAPGDSRRTAVPAAPSGRLGLLADAVRHLDRAKTRTGPQAPPRPVRAPHRKNMSFTNEEVRQIDRNNRILLNKIVAQQRRPPARSTSVSAGGRSRGTQDQIRRENMILLQKINTARPSRSVISGFHETPPPVRPILERGAVRHRLPWMNR